MMEKTMSASHLSGRGKQWKRQHEEMISALKAAKKNARPPSAMENIQILT